MQWVFALPQSASVTWGAHGLWLTRNDAFPADDPFVLAHPDMFSATPSTARSSDGRDFPQVPLSAELEPAAPTPVRGRRSTNV